MAAESQQTSVQQGAKSTKSRGTRGKMHQRVDPFDRNSYKGERMNMWEMLDQALGLSPVRDLVD